MINQRYSWVNDTTLKKSNEEGIRSTPVEWQEQVQRETISYHMIRKSIINGLES